MGAKDLFITPVWMAIILFVAFVVKGRFTNKHTRQYFIPALLVKMFGAILLGIIYYFYYGYGDTINYFEYGSKYIHEAFMESPLLGMKLIFAYRDYSSEVMRFAGKMWHYNDLPSYFVVRIAGLFDIFTFHTYSATAVFFATLSFTGVWALFSTFYKLYPHLHKKIAIAIFFIPSLFFWGSGIMKDTLTFAAVGWITYASFQLFIFKRVRLRTILVLFIAAFVLYHVKIYILMCYFPSFLVFLFLQRSKKWIPSKKMRVVLYPFLFSIAIAISYFGLVRIGENNDRYKVDNLARTAQITAQWINHVSRMEGGSGYTLGDMDYSPVGMVQRLPLAVWVALFRPHPWEVRNPVMLLSSIESTIFLFFVLRILFRHKFTKPFRKIREDPVLVFCIVFSIFFAFAVGISSYNFGTLARYKIPLMPFFLVAVFVLEHNLKRLKKRQVLLRKPG